jgi:hypothetical protein
MKERTPSSDTKITSGEEVKIPDKQTNVSGFQIEDNLFVMYIGQGMSPDEALDLAQRNTMRTLEYAGEDWTF